MKLGIRCLVLLGLFVLARTQVSAQGHFLRGDVDESEMIDVTDAINTLSFLFLGEFEIKCLDAGDFDDSGELDISDPISSLQWQFLAGSPPAAPWPTFEADPTTQATGDDGDLVDCKGEAIEVTGDITEDTVWTNDNNYRLVSAVFVRSGATLTIEKGTTILGDSETDGLLVVDRGGKIEAVGTENYPIVFTSDQPYGQRARGDWGGLILLGRGDNNVEGKEAEAEGLSGELWGGGSNVIPDDDSGRLSYVRVEFGGTEISEDNEVNSISIFGCGSQTTLDHVQCKYNSDDGFEWFGGSASLKWGMCTGIGDDSFDYSFGWNGNGQFWLTQQRADDADRGFEVDNSESEFGATPLTKPVLANVSLIGDPTTEFGEESTTGMTIRRGAGTNLYNAIVTGFKSNGLDLDDEPTFAHTPENGELIMDYMVFWNNGPDGDTHFASDDAGMPFTSEEFFTTMNENNTIIPSESTGPIVDPYNLDEPNFRPQGDATTSAFDPSTLGDFFDAATYKGAVAPEGEDWTQASWISYAQN